MKKLLVTIFLILFLATAYAIDVESYDGDEIPTGTLADQSSLTANQIQLIQRVASLENKLENKADKQDITNATQFLFDEITYSFQNKTDFMILAFALMMLSTAVMCWGLFFILKSQRRI